MALQPFSLSETIEYYDQFFIKYYANVCDSGLHVKAHKIIELYCQMHLNNVSWM